MRELQVQLLLLDLADQYLKMSSSYRPVFVQYLQDEYAGIDDVFGEMIDVLITGLYDYQNMMTDPESFTRSDDEVLTVREMQQRTNEFVTDLSERLTILMTLQHDEVDNPMENLETILESMVGYAKDVADEVMAESTTSFDEWTSEDSSSSSEMDME